MPGGLLQLVAYGAQDVYLTGNPQITFFKVVYRRHTNFAIESIEQTFNGSTNIGSTSVNVQITRNGDLINRIYFKGKIKNNDDAKSAALVPYYGLRLIKNVLLQIGSQTIDKHYSEWMYIWNELSMPVGKREGYHKMVGGNKRNSSTIIKANDEKIIYVPLEFWFCRNVGLALPLIALQYHEVKISMEFCTKNELLDTNSKNYCYDVITDAKVDAAHANDSHNSTNIVLEDAEMWIDYIFLDTDERRRFAQLSHEYLIEQLQFTGSEKITAGGSETMRSVKINFNHPCKELFWVIKPDQDTQSDTTYKPYWNNFTNKPENELYNKLNDVDDVLSSGVVDVDNPVTLARIQLNGADRFSERPGNYFSVIQPYQHHENTPGLYNMGINVYSFALKPEEHQPSGTLNMSRIDTAHLQVASSVTGMISVFAVNYNVLRILSGMGGLAYSN
jgi:hypothetical protein